jgi:hypothetical protein
MPGLTRSGVALVLLLVPSGAQAQERDSYAMLDAWHHLHRHVLAVLDSATPAMLGYRPVPGVRSFAEQIHHVNDVIVRITSAGVARQSMPRGVLGDTAATLHDIGQLRAQTERVFSFLLAALEAVPDSAFAEPVTLAGGSMPRWRWNLTALQHSAWTLGQTVPYLRMNNRAPPPFTPF